ncbi:MAG: sensor histidine kinase [Pseudobacter sp.]|uniref:sensor histidine kinase n=1 Tax=Pseudobacter sp. TaxID=2045420 RepID=UPI003F80147A
MRSWIQLALTLTVLLCLTAPATTYSRDNMLLQLQQWQLQRQEGLLSNADYLRKLDSVVFECFDRQDFPDIMEPYRHIVFSDTGFKERRIIYYQYRGIHSVNNNSTGNAVFYFSKMAEEASRQGNTARELAANRAMISIFADNEDYEKCFERYNGILPILQDQTVAAQDGRSSGMMIENVLGILQAITTLYYQSGKLQEARSSDTLLHQVMDAVNGHPEKYQPFLGKIRVVASSAAFAKAAWDLRDPPLASEKLNETIARIRHSGMQASMQAFFLYDEYVSGIRFFMDHNMADSAGRYLQLLNQLDLPMIRQKKDQFYHEQMARLLYSNGQAAEAYQHSAKALALKDSLIKSTLIDRDNNVYAQLQSESNQAKVQQLTQANSRAEKANIFLILLIITKLICAFLLFKWYRQNQRNRFYNAKLRMARNIHDEIGPMLLFVKLMAKKEKETVGASAHIIQMEAAINNVMETVRGLSHDLKSDKELSTLELYDEVKTLLDKTESLTGISYHFSFNHKDKPLNYFQYQHLRNILTELVNNTIKHAEWSRIDLMLKVESKKIFIVYTDNGQGFEPAYDQKSGIGLANIRERVEKLRGKLDLRNNFPEGYTIEINIPFK